MHAFIMLASGVNGCSLEVWLWLHNIKFVTLKGCNYYHFLLSALKLLRASNAYYMAYPGILT